MSLGPAIRFSPAQRWALGVLLALASARAAAGEAQPFVFLHTGDPELGKPDVASTAARFALVAARANAIGADLVIIPGDLVHGCTSEELKAFDGVLRQFKMPVKVVPGNHDRPDVFEKHFGPDHYVFTHNNSDFICLNSNRFVGPADPRQDAQWKWLEAALEDAQRQKRSHVFVVMHHPIAQEAPLRELLARHHVAAVLCGHLHTTQEFAADGFTVYVSPSTARLRDDKGFAYRVFKVYPDRVEQEVVPLDREVARIDLKAPAAGPAK